MNTKSEKGFALLELIVASLILGTFIAFSITGMRGIQESVNKQTHVSTKDEIIEKIVSDIRSNLPLFQAHYGPQSAQTLLSSLPDLPVAWSENSSISVKECERNGACPQGRYGFVIKPLRDLSGSIVPGLYKVTILLRHPVIFPRQDIFHEFIGAGI